MAKVDIEPLLNAANSVDTECHGSFINGSTGLCTSERRALIVEVLSLRSRPQPGGADLVYRLRKRAAIRRQINTRKSVQEGVPDRLADLLDEAAGEIERLQRQAPNAPYSLQAADKE